MKITPIEVAEAEMSNSTNDFIRTKPLRQFYRKMEFYLLVSGLYFGHPSGGMKSIIIKIINVLLVLAVASNALRFLLIFQSGESFDPNLVFKICYTVYIFNMSLNSHLIFRTHKCSEQKDFHLFLHTFKPKQKDYYVKLNWLFNGLCAFFTVFVLSVFIFSFVFIQDAATATFYEFSTAPFKYNSSGFTGMLYASVLVNMYGFQGWSASCILFITTCYVLSKELDLLNISVKKATGKDGSFSGNLELLRRQHDVICQMVGVADDIFCYYIGISMTAVVMLACLLLYGLARGVTDPLLLMGLVAQAMSVVNVTVILVVGCVAVSSKATSVAEYLFRINLDLMDPATINKIQVFLLRVTGSPIGLTTSRLFVLDKGAILTIVGTVVTYAVVLFQMPTSPTPSATSVCNETCLSK